ncbi:hypothetical protein SEVIR_5G371033v4 [Setaria viridis]
MVLLTLLLGPRVPLPDERWLAFHEPCAIRQPICAFPSAAPPRVTDRTRRRRGGGMERSRGGHRPTAAREGGADGGRRQPLARRRRAPASSSVGRWMGAWDGRGAAWRDVACRTGSNRAAVAAPVAVPFRGR